MVRGGRMIVAFLALLAASTAVLFAVNMEFGLLCVILCAWAINQEIRYMDQQNTNHYWMYLINNLSEKEKNNGTDEVEG